MELRVTVVACSGATAYDPRRSEETSMDPDTQSGSPIDGSESHKSSVVLQFTTDPLETAHQRLLLYLKALNIPVYQRYDLAEAALNRAAALHVADSDIVSTAMRCLREVLSADPRFNRTQDLEDFFFGQEGKFIVMPPLNRSSMIPVPLERTGPLKFFFFLLVRMILAPLRPPFRLATLCLLLAALIALFIWQTMR
ncbi:MAG: hypothetical protein N3B18_12390 [Desulfobacterota bacterium]|nr:hypothetical protein [Thermodesulfobacteriota bacterium]